MVNGIKSKKNGDSIKPQVLRNEWLKMHETAGERMEKEY